MQVLFAKKLCYRDKEIFGIDNGYEGFLLKICIDFGNVMLGGKSHGITLLCLLFHNVIFFATSTLS
jgi:hypothetical protein